MLASLMLVFREMIEAGLIISIVLSATRGVKGRSAWVTYGVLAGVLGACVVALFAGTIASAVEGYGQEWFNIGVLSLAVIMLTWHNVWMARHGRQMAFEMKQVGAEVVAGSRTLMALATVVAVAVLREGSEVVLFMYGIMAGGDETMTMLLLGALGGFVLGAALSAAMYLGLINIPVKKLFTVTGWMIALLAAGMASQVADLLQQAGTVELLENTLWDSSAILSDGSVMGKVLATLIGYTARPTELQLLVYVGTLAVIFTLMRLFGHVPQQPKTPLPGAASA